ncbi:MAG: quinone oxidoreductase, partial [Geopsychrobacter sp.]|nr:quinone oxidoreductase [Geopsychrobacter sp.]
EVPAPGSGEVQLRQTAIGLNFIDVYHRTGLYPLADMPAVIGMEGAGIVEALGEGVDSLAVGDRVAYAAMPVGAYAEMRNMPADKLVKIPGTISDEQAAAIMLQGMTAQYLIRSTYRVKSGETILVHAAAGGVGLLACQWAAHLGATIIGTVGSEEKAQLAKDHGCTHTILYRDENFVERVKELTNGEGVDVVYDAIGKDTFPGSLDCLKPLGLWASFGASSGPIEDFNIGILGQKGSLFATRPSLFAYVSTRKDLLETAQDLFDVVEQGHVKISINQTYDLKDAAQAHKDLEARKTTGSTILIP